MKTLYVSDLDGTLLNGNQRTSDFTNKTINTLVKKGMIFSYATARSYHTSKIVTEGLCEELPIIMYNGAFILNGKTGEFLASNFFDKSFYSLFEDLISSGVFPIVYSFIDKKEKFSYIYDNCSLGMKKFIQTKQNDSRNNPVDTLDELKTGTPFYITCIDCPSKLKPIYEKYRNEFHCIYQTDIYSNEQWLEIMPKTASKSNAVLQLKSLLNCNKVVVFGDGINDVDMFRIADECYAVSNAVDELKNLASGIIDSNDNNGVAKWLNINASFKLRHNTR